MISSFVLGNEILTILGKDLSPNGKESVEEELLTIDGANNGNLQSGVHLEGLDDSDSDLENPDDEVSDSDVDSSLEDEMDGNLSEYLSSESESDPEQDENLESSNLEVVQQVFDDDEIDQRQFEKIFLEKPAITKTLDIRHKRVNFVCLFYP